MLDNRNFNLHKLTIAVFLCCFFIFAVFVLYQKWLFSNNQSFNEDSISDYGNYDFTDKMGDEKEGLIPNEDKLLGKMFPSLVYQDGEKRIYQHDDNPNFYLTIDLEDSVEDYFMSSNEKTRLLIVNLSGYHYSLNYYYLGLFDSNDNLLTPVFDFSLENKGFFRGFRSNFSFYDCQGMKYILAVVGSRCNGCWSDQVTLHRITDGAFESIPDGIGNINLQNRMLAIAPFSVYANENGIEIKESPNESSLVGSCPETDYVNLYWNKDKCRFE